ncbi:PH domain-containing protein [Phycisphaerales bacterium AB-hyl4]|uniref:PH domain-containing protein n=1 Tax=Natronomicrosphaera hydrolytica TaxID=3242702 RepID=A0ABV4U407_9BACT
MNQIDTHDPRAPKASDAPEEEVFYCANPAMFRARPIWFSLGVLGIVGGVAGAAFAMQLEGDLRLAGLAVGLGMSAIAMLAMAWWWLQTRRTTFIVTSSRTRLRRGLLSVHITEVWHRHVRNVQLTQTVWERIVGVGTLSIASAGKAGWDVQVSGLPRIYKAKETIDQYRLAMSQESD